MSSPRGVQRILRFSICIGDPYVKRKIGCLNKDAPRGVVNPWVLQLGE